MATALVCGGLAVLYACGSGPTKGAGPTINVDPAALVFSGVVAGDTVPQTVTVANTGTSDLVIRAITVSGTGYALDDASQKLIPMTIASGADKPFTVTFKGQVSGTPSGTAEITSNDYVTPKLSIPLTASNNGPRIACTPSPIDFALVENRAGPVTATCHNAGTAPFPVESTFLDGSSEFSIDTSLAAGTTLNVGDSFTVTVGYTMSLAGNGKGFFVVKPGTTGMSRGLLPLYGAPVASAGADITVAPLTAVNLDGSRSRAPGNSNGVSSYAWTITRSPTGSKTAAQFMDGTVPQEVKDNDPKCSAGQKTLMSPCFFPDVAGIYTFALTVRDHRADCPLAGSGACQDGSTCCSFSCSGGSCAGTGGICGAGGIGCDIDSTDAADPTHPDLDAEVEIHAIPEAGIYVQLKWDNSPDGDFDLHLVRESAVPLTGRKWNDRQSIQIPPGGIPDGGIPDGGLVLDGGLVPGTAVGNDCYYNNPNPDWGSPDPTNGLACVISADCKHQPYTTCRGSIGLARCIDASDDPRLLIDMTTGGGPEAIEMRLPPSDSYHIGVDHFPNQINTNPGIATVIVFVGGAQVNAYSQQLGVSDFWYVGHLDVPPDLTTATLVPAQVQSSPYQDCSVVGANPCHRGTPSDYPVIPPLP
jgi:hypothetical protein